MDILTYILLLLIGGCFAGFMAGLLGIGGGIIITPIQYFLLTSIGCEAKTAITITFATGLAVICATMLNSTNKHQKNNLIVKRYLKEMMILGFLGTVIGAVISQYISVDILKVAFGVVCIVSTIVLTIIRAPATLNNIKTDKTIYYIVSLLGGLFSGLIGPAGGAIMIPVFIGYFKYPIRNTIGTTSAMSITTTLGGVLCYILIGWNVQGLPDFSLGYVNLLQFIFLTVTSIPISTWAANLARKISTKKLKALQITVITYIGLQMIGIIDILLSLIP